MKLTARDLPSCHRAFLEAAADSLRRRLPAEPHLADWLAQVEAAIPEAPDYVVEGTYRP